MNNKRNIKVIQMLPALESGGVERGTLELARFLVANGHQSIVISAGGRMAEQLVAEGSRHVIWDVGAKHISTIKWIPRVREFLTKESPDILHLRSRLPAWVGYLAWKKLPVEQRPNLVTTVHGPYTVNRYSAVMTKGERVIAVSKMIKDYIRDNYQSVPSEIIRTIYRGVDRSVYPYGFEPDSAWEHQWNSDYPALSGRFIVTLPARLTRWKGQEDFIEIIGALKQRGIPVVGFVVGGAHRRKTDYADRLVEQVADRGLDGTIFFLGNRTDLREIMSISDVVLSLSLEPEAFGRTVIEALSLGRPVAGYNHGGVAEQLGEVLSEGLVPVGNREYMIELLEQWYSNPPTVLKEHQFTLDNMLEKTLAVYQELIG